MCARVCVRELESECERRYHIITIITAPALLYSTIITPERYNVASVYTLRRHRQEEDDDEKYMRLPEKI